MADVAKLLVAPTLLGTAASTLYTVPAATTTIIRNIHINNTTATNYTFSLAINGSPATAASAIYSGFWVATGTAFDWSGFMVLPANATLQGLASAAASLNITVSGIESA